MDSNSTKLANLDAAISTRLATAGYTAPLDAAGTRTAVGLASANLDTQLDALPTNSELTTALAGLNNVSSAQVQTAAAAALTAYDPPTRAEATSDKAEIITEVNANETKIDAIKAKTDGLTFSIAGEVDANVKCVNDIDVVGDGDSTPWGPA
jgi:hypothetical protein